MNKAGIWLIEGENRDTGASNESGKSTIFEALSWCLYGRYAAGGGRSGDEVVNPEVGRDCRVVVRLIDGRSEWQVTRTRLYGSSQSSVLQIKASDDRSSEIYDLRKKSTADSTKAVESLLGVSYDVFVQGFYFAQENQQPFGTLTDKELKTFFIEKLLQLDWIPEALEKAKTNLKTIEDKLSKQEAHLSHQLEMLYQTKQTIKRYTSKYRELKAESLYNLPHKMETIKKAASSLHDEKKRKKELKTQIDILVNEISQIQVSDVSKKISELEKRESSLVTSIARLEREAALIKEKLKSIADERSSVKQLIDKKCGFCGNTIKQSNISTVKKNYDSNIEIQKHKLEEANKELSSNNMDLATVREWLEEHKTEYEKSKSELTRKSELNSLLTQARSQYNSISLSDKRDIVVMRCFDYKTSKSKHLDIMDSEIRPRVKRILNERAEIGKTESGMEAIKEEVYKAEFWVGAFSPKGIQSFMINSVIRSVNYNINEYMKDLSNGRITVAFNTIKVLGSGETRESINLLVKNIDGGDSYVSLSGGAKRRVDIAISLGIADFKRSLHGNNLKFLCFDEALSGVDQEWVERFLKLAKRKFHGWPVFYITHQPADRSLFDGAVTVVKENGETRI